MFVEIVPEKNHPLYQNDFGKDLVKGEPVEVPEHLLAALVTSGVIKKKPTAKKNVAKTETNPAPGAEKEEE